MYIIAKCFAKGCNNILCSFNVSEVLSVYILIICIMLVMILKMQSAHDYEKNMTSNKKKK